MIDILSPTILGNPEFPSTGLAEPKSVCGLNPSFSQQQLHLYRRDTEWRCPAMSDTKDRMLPTRLV
jgi:hypothetical protein